jgi:hypothetical protein
VNLFKELKILPFISRYIFSLLSFISNNKNYFLINSENHSIHTRSCSNFHLPLANLAVYQKGVYYSGVKVLLAFHKILKMFLTILKD